MRYWFLSSSNSARFIALPIVSETQVDRLVLCVDGYNSPTSNGVLSRFQRINVAKLMRIRCDKISSIMFTEIKKDPASECPMDASIERSFSFNRKTILGTGGRNGRQGTKLRDPLAR